MENLPYSGIYHASEQRRYEDVVVFVHHFGGSENSSNRHVQKVNEWGFDAVTFRLRNNQVKPPIPLSSQMEIGAIPVWGEQIELVLNQISGKKIVYSFSSPSNGALLAIARRQAIDVSAWICDGGPFLRFYSSVWKLLSDGEMRIGNPALRIAATAASKWLFGQNFENQTEASLHKLPENFPILSVRGWRDPVVTPESIQAYFDRRKDLNLEVLSLPEGRHLDGLKNCASTYEPRLENFLKAHAQTFKD